MCNVYFPRYLLNTPYFLACFAWISSVTILKCCGQGADLLLKDLCKLGVFASVITRVAAIANFVKADRTTLAIYHEKTELSLITPNPSRFATHLISAMRMLKVRGRVLRLEVALFCRLDF